MAGKLRNHAPLLIVLLLAMGVGVAVWKHNPAPPKPPAPQTHRLADLGSPPDWSRLDPYQGVIPRGEFQRLLEEVYTIGAGWKQLIKITDTGAVVTKGSAAKKPETYHLAFAPDTPDLPPARYWRPADQLEPAPAGRPLDGLRIAIDPGHIGGRYAKMEERWFQIDERSQPVMEGEMTLLASMHLKTRLEKLGASVTLLRNSNAPVTKETAEDLEPAARRLLGSSAPEEVCSFAERLFYRTAEIRARADLVNGEVRPDLVLCLHFNAEGWGDPLAPRFSPRNHFHILLNGAYTPAEVLHDDERFEMLLRIAQGVHSEELAVAVELATAFQEVTTLPPYEYEPASLRAINLGDNPYLWARNLLANRLYECPVLFLEPYVMNNAEVYARAQAGDYEGMREVAGALRPSIYREYAEAVALGLERYYGKNRKP